MYEVYTLQEVVQEIRDEKARLFLQNLPYELMVKSAVNIEEEDVQTVEEFSRETGDKNTLSHVDKLVIAFGMTLSREKDEYENVNKTPQNLEEFRPKGFKKHYDDNGESSDDGAKPTFKADDGWTTTGPNNKKVDTTPFDEFQDTATTKNKRRADIKNHEMDKYQEKIEKQKAMLGIEEDKKEKEPEVKQDMAVVAEEESSEYDDEEEGGQWVTEENLYSNIGGAAGDLLMNNDNELFASSNVKPAETEEEVKQEPKKADKFVPKVKYVKFITSDYAMQNVIIQMGFQLLNLDGRLLTQVKRFKLLCKGCDTINMDTERLFCDTCGGAHMAKVSVYLNANGELTYFKNPKRKINLRGNVYSIPKMKGGRGC